MKRKKQFRNFCNVSISAVNFPVVHLPKYIIKNTLSQIDWCLYFCYAPASGCSTIYVKLFQWFSELKLSIIRGIFMWTYNSYKICFILHWNSMCFNEFWSTIYYKKYVHYFYFKIQNIFYNVKNFEIYYNGIKKIDWCSSIFVLFVLKL